MYSAPAFARFALQFPSMLRLFQNERFRTVFAWAVIVTFIPCISALAIKQAIPKDEVHTVPLCLPSADPVAEPFPSLDFLF